MTKRYWVYRGELEDDRIQDLEYVEVVLAKDAEAEVEQLREALAAMTPEFPWYDDGGQDCRWCGGHYHSHYQGCDWANAQSLIASRY